MEQGIKKHQPTLRWSFKTIWTGWFYYFFKWTFPQLSISYVCDDSKNYVISHFEGIQKLLFACYCASLHYLHDIHFKNNEGSAAGSERIMQQI